MKKFSIKKVLAAITSTAIVISAAAVFANAEPEISEGTDASVTQEETTVAAGENQENLAEEAQPETGVPAETGPAEGTFLPDDEQVTLPIPQDEEGQDNDIMLLAEPTVPTVKHNSDGSHEGCSTDSEWIELTEAIIKSKITVASGDNSDAPVEKKVPLGDASTTTYYYLEKDIDLGLIAGSYANTNFTIALNFTNCVLCLNGHKITAYDKIFIDGIFSLYDCNGGGEVICSKKDARNDAAMGFTTDKARQFPSCTFNLYSGKIVCGEISTGAAIHAINLKRYNGEVNGGIGNAVRHYLNIYEGEISGFEYAVMAYNTEIKMYDGKISENSKAGFSIDGNSELTMTDGTIEGSSGCAVKMNQSTFNMFDNAAITGCEQRAVLADNRSTFNMTGGTINGNTVCSSDDPDSVSSVVKITGSSNFHMSGGEIKDNIIISRYNSSGEDACAVYIDTGCNLYVKYSPKIIGNTVKSYDGKIVKKGNVNTYHTRDGATDKALILIQIEGELTSGAEIGVMHQRPTFDNSDPPKAEKKVAEYADSVPQNAEYLNYFKSDIDWKYIKNIPDPPVSGETEYVVFYEKADHIHDVYGESDTPDDITFQRIDQNYFSSKSELTTGAYYLSGPITLTSLTLRNSTTLFNQDNDVYLCLNGYTLTVDKITLGVETMQSTINLCDCGSGGTIIIKGSVNEGISYKYVNAGAFYASEKEIVNTFNMYGGIIKPSSDSTATIGINMKQNVNGTSQYETTNVFNMYGGEISDFDTAVNAAHIRKLHNMGPHNRDDGGAEFNMYGGEISGGANGVGVKIGVDDADNNSRFNMYGGIITGFKTGVDIGTYAGTLFTVSGNPVIYGNTDKNVYIPEGQLIHIDSSGLGADACIGFLTEEKPSASNETVNVADGNNQYAEYFHSDDKRYTAKNKGNMVVIIETIGDLTVSSVVETGGNANSQFNFTLKLTDARTGLPVSGEFGGITFTNGEYSFTLTGTDEASFAGLPAGGVNYTVTENSVPAGYASSKSGETGEIKTGDPAKAVFTYSPAGSLKLTSTVKGDDGGSKDFAYVVELTGDGASGINGEYGGIKFTGGKSDPITLRGTRSITISGLPAGYTYKVTQTSAPLGYTVSPGKEIGGTNDFVIVFNKTAEVEFTNSPVEIGSLKVSISIAENNSRSVDGFTFTVVLGDSDINGELGGIEFEAGKSEKFTLTASDPEKLFEGLPADVSYKVIPENPPEGYTLDNSEGESGTILKDETVNAVFTYKMSSGNNKKPEQTKPSDPDSSDPSGSDPSPTPAPPPPGNQNSSNRGEDISSGAGIFSDGEMIEAVPHSGMAISVIIVPAIVILAVVRKKRSKTGR